MLHWVIRKILGRIAVIPVRFRRFWPPFELATHAPRSKCKEDLRQRIVTRQAGTDFGRGPSF